MTPTPAIDLLGKAQRGEHRRGLVREVLGEQSLQPLAVTCRKGRGRSQAVTSPLLKVTGLKKAYGAIKAVDGVSFEVMPGEIFGVIGPAQSGKTTLLRAINRTLEFTAGASGSLAGGTFIVQAAGTDSVSNIENITGSDGVDGLGGDVQRRRHAPDLRQPVPAAQHHRQPFANNLVIIHQ